MEFAFPHLRENRLMFSADDSYQWMLHSGKFFMLAYLWVAIGGALGSVTRFWINGLVIEKLSPVFPWGTLVINVTGSFLIGVIGALAIPEGRMDSPSRQFATQFLMLGVCGGYTTFSSFSLQTLNLLRDREWLYAGGNVILSVALCMIAVWLGWLLGDMFNSMKGN
jgi:CrcB protein